MSDAKTLERAINEIEKQLEELNDLRNANTRDPVFKFWRQTTLTSIQRTWPGDDTRSFRFRRIPFSPPSTRVDAKMAREWFERGCGEAGVFLRELLTELQTVGITHVGPTKRSRPEPLPVDEVPILNLGGPSTTASPPPRATPHSPPPTISRLPAPPEAPSRPMPGMTPVGPAPVARRAPGTGGRAGKKGNAVKRPAATQKMRLKDMLGFSDGTEAEAAAEAAHEAPPTLTPQAPRPPAENPPSRGPRTGNALPEAAAPPEFQMPPVPVTASQPQNAQTLGIPPLPEAPRIDEATLQRALEAAIQNFVSRDPEPESDAIDLLSSSPVFNVKAKPVRRRAPGPEGTYRTPAAVAVAVIATEVTSLNIPETQMSRASAALLDLAGHLDQHDLTWGTLKEAVGFVMEYPAIARRVLPILLPFLEEAA